ncbi:galactokinase [Solicola sp. PLA-1-18]|uniref:galactokinase n=1 Tax=Solicola sp. PLA-1-18 TaxID=3380532 RepID=UPI003B784A32
MTSTNDAPVRAWAAPGRVNLIGEHLDYNGGPALPFAIDRTTRLKARPRTDGRVRVWSSEAEGSVEFGVDTEPGQVDGWAGYVAGVVWACAQDGHVLPGYDLVLESDVPLGAGLSSSAALECVVALAVRDLQGLDLTSAQVARLAQTAENDYVGAPTGSMDQLASACCEDGHALLVDTRTEPPTLTSVPAGWDADGLAVVVVDTRAEHTHASGEYATRRSECEQVAELVGVEQLALAPPDAILKVDDPVLKARLRHVMTETTRTRAAVRALRERQWEHLGTLLTASHVSLRDDYEVSCMELDVAVDAALEAGAFGARMTGGGFGGSAIALVPREGVDAVVAAVEKSFAHAELTAPRSFVVSPGRGAHEVVR